MPKIVSVRMEVMSKSRNESLQAWLQNLVNTKGDKIKILSVKDEPEQDHR